MRIFSVFLTMIICGAGFASDFNMVSDDFADANMMPVIFTCDGKNTPPKFNWEHPPKNTAYFALLMTDTNLAKYSGYHWLVYNIPKQNAQLSEKDLNQLPVAKNSFGKIGYDGPCPPKDSLHAYLFTLYALDQKVPYPKGEDVKKVLEFIEKHSIDQTSLTGLYSRWY